MIFQLDIYNSLMFKIEIYIPAYKDFLWGGGGQQTDPNQLWRTPLNYLLVYTMYRTLHYNFLAYLQWKSRYFII